MSFGPIGYETDFSEDEQKTDELRDREEACFFVKEASCFPAKYLAFTSMCMTVMLCSHS
jgi:hypothetical protein